MTVDVHPDEVQPFAEVADIKLDASFATVVVAGCDISAEHVVDVNGNVLAVFNRAEFDVYYAAGWVGVDADFVFCCIVFDVNIAVEVLTPNFS